MEYVNTDAHARVWPTLQHPDGCTLGLEPGETVDLDVEVEDPSLQPAAGGRRRKPAATVELDGGDDPDQTPDGDLPPKED